VYGLIEIDTRIDQDYGFQ